MALDPPSYPGPYPWLWARPHTGKPRVKAMTQDEQDRTRPPTRYFMRPGPDGPDSELEVTMNSSRYFQPANVYVVTNRITGEFEGQ
jgi:hypothetical protein